MAKKVEDPRHALELMEMAETWERIAKDAEVH
jgi:hypothetical protein